MKNLVIIYSIVFCLGSIHAQTIPQYYNDVNLQLTGLDLKNELSQKISSTHTNTLTYSQVWDVLKSSDLDPLNGNLVMLLYGWDNSDLDITNDLTRNKNLNGGNPGEWNREHTYPKSLGTPDLGTSGPGADAHNLRATDVQRNGSRGNKKFATGSGQNSGAVGPNWYPGDQWKGDVARIIMYMYLRYNNQCKPSGVCVGNPVSVDLNMVDLLLTWNAQDPSDNFEIHRNEIIHQNQGNRNPFIDNPYLATLIWGGTAAENFWNLSDNDLKISGISIYPNPATNGLLQLKNQSAAKVKQIDIFNNSGHLIYTLNEGNISKPIIVENLATGIYWFRIITSDGILTRKIIIK